MLRFAVHPRIARVVVEGERRGVFDDACVAAAILAEGDIRAYSRRGSAPLALRTPPTEQSDLGALVDRFREVKVAFFGGLGCAADLDAGATHAVARAASQLVRAGNRRRAHGPANVETALAMALLAGYPDRVARRVRPGGRQMALAAGGWQAELARRAWCATPSGWWRSTRRRGAQGARAAVVVRLASGIAPEWLIELFPGT